ncbi:MAG: patatin-like phospholipase family protein [Hyphomicrobiaceae bacterium]
MVRSASRRRKAQADARPERPAEKTAQKSEQPNHAPAKRPRIGLALGGGGARGLAHIPALEAFDELGIKPDIIAGTSIGAIYGGAYASGIAARDLRAHTTDVLTQRLGLMRELFNARSQAVNKVLRFFNARSALLDPHALLDIVMPPETAIDFADLEIPIKIVATDFYEQTAVVFTSGSVKRAIAASMALPVVFEPIVIDGVAMIDGGLSNPLPFDLISEDADIIVAVDVTGAPAPSPHRDYPSAFEVLFSSPFIFERTIVQEKLKSCRPDILIEGGTSHFQTLDFLKVEEILSAAEPVKDKLKMHLERVLASETLAVVEEDKSGRSLPATADEIPARKRRIPRIGKRKIAPAGKA